MLHRAVFSVSVISFSLLGCATVNEPQTHIRECHVSNGLLVDNLACITDHEKIVADRVEKSTKQRMSRSVDSGARR